MTNQTENGNCELENDVFANKWEETSQVIEDYLKRIKGKSKQPEGIVDKILQLSYEELKILAHEECGEYAFILSQYSYFLQQELNYHTSKLTWCQSTLTYLTANYGNPQVKNNSFIKKEEKVALLAHSYKNIKTLIDMEVRAKIMCDSLNMLSKHIDNMIKTLLNLQQSKRQIGKL